MKYLVREIQTIFGTRFVVYGGDGFESYPMLWEDEAEKLANRMSFQLKE